MLQVVFSDSERGALKQATRCKPSTLGPIGVIYGDRDKLYPAEWTLIV